MLKIDQFAAANKACVDSVFGLAGQVLQVGEQLVSLNLQATKKSLAELAETTQTALSAKSPAGLGTQGTVALQAATQKALAYAGQVKDIVTAATANVTKVTENAVKTSRNALATMDA
jgi:phasin family protein